MAGKKKPGRFTLQFNLEDPQQQTVSELLEQQGRHKAQFLTSAVLYYIQHPDAQAYDGAAPKIDEAMLERMLLSIMKKHPQLSSILADGTPPEKEVPSLVVHPQNGVGGSIGADTIAAISETLAAFQQESN